MQINLAIAPPIREMVRTMGRVSLFKSKNLEAIRKRPYLPSLSKTPARTIDPATGASTWALGNQRWAKKRGVFTKNAAIVISHQVEAKNEDEKNSQLGVVIESCPLVLYRKIREINSGREAVTVYIIRYMLA